MSSPHDEDADREAYEALADEMNDADVGPWDESNWDPQDVAAGARFAAIHGFSWPPQTGDFDRYYDHLHN